jgi:hypothetical protein
MVIMVVHTRGFQAYLAFCRTTVGTLGLALGVVSFIGISCAVVYGPGCLGYDLFWNDEVEVQRE